MVNNAGYGLAGELEGTPDEAARDIFETLFWGVVNVSREALEVFRESNRPIGGRLINMSSVLGIVASPLGAFYNASKFGQSRYLDITIITRANQRTAIEGLTETIALELDPEWNVKVRTCFFATIMAATGNGVVIAESFTSQLSLVEPGYFKTGMYDNALILKQHPAYTRPGSPSMTIRERFQDPDLIYRGDAKKAVAKIYQLARLDDPPLRLALGKDCINMLRTKLDELAKGVDKYESWSEDLLRDD